ncbi:MAG: hypothetical protein EOP83_06015 [Verrucomicrobiaceae bacterium]|nr:MAG: hypothetical protein EOP83_06015 [Verrucomicrobiaceae bacterium]
MTEVRFIENPNLLCTAESGEPPPHAFTILHDWGRGGDETFQEMRRVEAWCEDQFGPQGARWGTGGSPWNILFAWKADAALFKLRWV